MNMKTPTVAIIGQTNAGKSSLFNRIARSKQAIVAREEGTTRDNVVTAIAVGDRSFYLVDTAGLKNPDDEFEESIQEQIEDAVENADLILVTLDSTKYVNQDDKNIARKALKSRKPVILVLNKCDLKESLPDSEFVSLGIKNKIRVSAEHNKNVRELVELIIKTVPYAKAVQEEDDVLRLALIGRPNVGKSSLFNTLAKKQQAVVANLAGTTRDINRVKIKYKGQAIELLDTAGVRRPGKQEVGIEKFSVLRTMSAIEEADVCLMLVDGTEPHSQFDQHLVGIINEVGKGIVVVVTKWDIVQSEDHQVQIESSNRPTKYNHKASKKSRSKTEAIQEEHEAESIIDGDQATDIILAGLSNDFNFIPFAPVVLTSSVDGKNVMKILDLALQINEERHKEAKTSELNRVLHEAIAAHTPAGLKNTLPKPKYIVQTDTCPPWFVVHGRHLKLLHWSWKRYLDRKIREEFGFMGTPIKFSFRDEERSKPDKHGSAN
jgi:ribosome-associated GTPase EngA